MVPAALDWGFARADSLGGLRGNPTTEVPCEGRPQKGGSSWKATSKEKEPVVKAEPIQVTTQSQVELQANVHYAYLGLGPE